MSLGGDNFLDAAASFLGDNSKFPGAGLFNYNRENAKKLAAVVDDLSKSKSLIHKTFIQVYFLLIFLYSMIYCSGDLLAAVNIHSLYTDSKTFVDKPLKDDPAVVYRAFKQQFSGTPLYDIDRGELRDFVDKYFEEPGTELEPCNLTDWQKEPPMIMKIRDPTLRQWALELNGIWKKLCRKMKPVNPERNSLIYVPNEFIAPGGRFREFFYWDTYWIIKGLLISGMYNTTKYGFIPNGGRIYFLKRSQPPMFAPMVYQYYQYTHDKVFLKKMLPTLEKELNFWRKRRVINVTLPGSSYTYRMYHYRTESNVPRPESYREDLTLATKVDKNKRLQLYQDIASAAESGWDFSTRWFSDRKTLGTIKTTKIVPVDLNAYLCWDLGMMEYFYREYGNFTRAREMGIEKAKIRFAIQNVFYNDTLGAWFDYDTEKKAHNPNFYPSVVMPLFATCYQEMDLAKPQRVYDYMEKAGAFNYPGGIPTSLVKETNEQWDFPNGFPPLQHLIIEGMRKSNNAQTQQQVNIKQYEQITLHLEKIVSFRNADLQAFEIARRWVEWNYRVYKETGAMWEKYNVSGTVPQPGEGGEYGVQDGFGWTNGVILDLLTSYSNMMTLPEEITTTENGSFTKTAAVFSVSYSLLCSISLLLLLHQLFNLV
ncbi:unnamed protein product [Enterobius vermicularis]|uniref:Trehalase n=1 Tax=Enterobius vermicularis TaxID=51028 RepID=A0A0N4VKW9_ENTVE|nr:unnamed protein product [Enterobius vermicularis]